MVDEIEKVLGEPWRLRALAAMNGLSEDKTRTTLKRLRERARPCMVCGQPWAEHTPQERADGCRREAT